MHFSEIIELQLGKKRRTLLCILLGFRIIVAQGVLKSLTIVTVQINRWGRSTDDVADRRHGRILVHNRSTLIAGNAIQFAENRAKQNSVHQRHNQLSSRWFRRAVYIVGLGSIFAWWPHWTTLTIRNLTVNFLSFSYPKQGKQNFKKSFRFLAMTWRRDGLYIRVLSGLAFEWKRGWSWVCHML